MRIASFNLENLACDWKSHARLPILRNQLARLNADIMCLQEVDGDHPSGSKPRQLLALDELLRGTPYQDFHRVHTTHPGISAPRGRHNLVILSRWSIRDHAQFMNDLVPPPHYKCVTSEPPQSEHPIEWDRPILHARIELPSGQILHLINMHLKAPLASLIAGQKIGPFAWASVSGWAEGFFLAAVKRAGQALEARMLIDGIFNDDADALLAVCGDFNVEERDISFRIVAGRTEDTGNGLLADCELIPLEHSVPISQRFTIIHGGRHKMLDHILVSRSLLALYREMEIHNEALGDELVAYTQVNDRLESFHAPVVATFSEIP
jgi:endonuclease/exonuclease/phosphatase family metal-dependent hydrolase